MPTVAPLIDEVTKKSAVMWIAVGDAAPIAAWFVWDEAAAYVLHGDGEQQVPGLAAAATVTAIVRSADTGARVVSWEAAVQTVAPGSAAWQRLQPILVKQRLNSPDGEAAAARWLATCTLSQLTPTGELIEEPGRMRPGSGAEAPRPTSATTRAPLPFVLGRRRTR